MLSTVSGLLALLTISNISIKTIPHIFEEATARVDSARLNDDRMCSILLKPQLFHTITIHLENRKASYYQFMTNFVYVSIDNS